MIIKSSAIDRMLQQHPNLGERRFGLPEIGGRDDGDSFNPTVQEIADAIEYYGFEVRDDDIATVPDIDLGSGNPTKYPPFPMSIEEMKKSLDSLSMYKYPYTEGADDIRQVLLDYVEKEGFINTQPYNYSDIDDKGLCVHNITFLPSTSIAFNMIVNIISKPGDVVLVTGPNYGLFTIRAERAGAEVDILPLSKEDNWLVNPEKLANKIDDVNDSLQKVYHRRKGYIPRVVAFVNANPNNPTGKVMGEKQAELLKEIGEVCLKRGVFIIDDLVYRDLTFDSSNLAKPELINRIFQGMDSAPDIVGRALAGAFNVRPERDHIYQDYFSKLRKIYQDKYQLLKALVEGIDTITDNKLKDSILQKITSIISDKKLQKQVLQGLPYTKFPDNLEPESGFFAILDFTKVRGMKYQNMIINTERDLLTFFYRTYRTRFLVGQSISWPYPNELVGRVTFALEDEKIISALTQMNLSLHLLTPGEDYIIRKNLRKDQVQIAHIKIDGWRCAYDKIIASKYLKSLDYEEQTQRYLSSFEEYKDLVFVAVRRDEVLGYACFSPRDKSNKYDSELVSLYIKKSESGRGIGSSLLIATAKELYSLGKNNMIVWCFADNTNAIQFYEGLGGLKVEEKMAHIGEEDYLEYGYYFDLEKVTSEN